MMKEKFYRSAFDRILNFSLIVIIVSGYGLRSLFATILSDLYFPFFLIGFLKSRAQVHTRSRVIWVGSWGHEVSILLGKSVGRASLLVDFSANISYSLFYSKFHFLLDLFYSACMHLEQGDPVEFPGMPDFQPIGLAVGSPPQIGLCRTGPARDQQMVRGESISTGK